MINSSFEDVTAPGSSDPKGFDPIQKLQRPNTKYFSFHRKRQTLENDVHPKQGEPTGNGEVIDKFDKSESKKSGFLRNFKRQLRLKSFSLCKSKQKVKAIENNPSNGSTNAILLSQEATGRERVSSNTSDVTSPKFKNNEIPDREISSLEDNSKKENLVRESETNSESPCSLNSLSNNDENSLVKIGNIAEPQSSVSREVVSSSIEDQFSNESRAKANLTEELLKLSKYGWYWGPISGDEADAKLVSEPDGAFLVRDSSDERYLLTLSFKSSGKLLHARMEHNRGLFSLYNHPETEGFTSVAALINHSMNFSQSAVFCYSRPRYPGYPSFPVRLTKPVSRFTQVRSLQYLCRFVIRQNTRFDNIHKLPLPKTIRGYIEEAHY